MTLSEKIAHHVTHGMATVNEIAEGLRHVDLPPDEAIEHLAWLADRGRTGPDAWAIINSGQIHAMRSVMQ